MAMNIKPRLYPRLAFNLVVAVVIGVCFGVRPGIAQQSGRWSTANPNPFPFSPIHSHILPTVPTAKVMIWPGNLGISGNDPRSWDPVTGTISPLAKPGFDVFCSGHSFLADGRLFVAGGNLKVEDGTGLRNASIYDPFNGTGGTWTALPDMNAARWYPTVTVLENGDVLVVAGLMDNGPPPGPNVVPQVFQFGIGTSGAWRNLPEMGQDLYPPMLLAPNGKVFNPGQSVITRYLDTDSGAWSDVDVRFYDTTYRDYAPAVMYAPGKVLVMGGGDPPTNTSEVIDLNQPSPTWRPTGNPPFPAGITGMAIARRHHNATLLPDGTVLVTGGTSKPTFNTEDDSTSAVHNAELWNPATERWTTLARSSGIPRIYHSSAVLLPDARVLSMGGDRQPTSEIYEPPYLFTGTQRPVITSAPLMVAYGQTFFVGTSDPAAISKVTMLRLTSVTHTVNMSQYFNTLPIFSRVTGAGLNVVAPAKAADPSPAAAVVAPPGPYMLFILNGSGVPSEAKIVRLARLSSIAVTPVGPSISIGATQQFTATGTYPDGRPTVSPQQQDIRSQVTWTSSNTAVATIDGSGLATGKAAGSTTISWTLSGTGVPDGSTTLTVSGSTGALQFSPATYSVVENAGTATVTVTRTGGSAGAVGVTVATSTGGTATASVDYTAVSQTVSFATGDTAKTVTIPILNDATAETNETVNLTLSNPTGGATLGTPSTAVTDHYR